MEKTKYSWQVLWNEYSAETYMFGSTVEFNNDNSVLFHNELMPSGTVIKRWYSKTHFQGMYIEPTLPIIDGERKYRIILEIEYPNGGNILCRINYFDKYNKKVGEEMVVDKVFDFSCPLSTYSYTVELVNGGVKDFIFRRIIIQELMEE